VRPIYLDHNASTPLDPRVADAMRLHLDDAYGNPSSPHWAGRPAREAVERARAQVAELVGASVDEIVFTSGGSEANNLALKGVFFAARKPGAHIVVTAVEHPSVLSPVRFLEGLGAAVSVLPVDGTGRIDPSDLRRAIVPRTVLVSVMHANNEVGTIQPIAECSRIAREHDVLLHTDASQSIGKIPTRVGDLGVDLLSLAGHKLGAPKGVGALYVRRGVRLEPLLHGAGHEGGRRAGTESALLTVGLGEACVAGKDLTAMEGVRVLRDALWQRLRDRFGAGVVLNGHPEHRLPNTLNVSFVGRVGADLLALLDGVAASTGSACHAGRVELSPVLAAMGVTPEVGMGAIRFSLGRSTAADEIEAVVKQIDEALASPRTR
jgi:cysteine desulfurase